MGCSGESCKKRRRLLITSLTYQAREFFVNSTLHGVRYMSGGDRPFFEKFLWFCSTSSGTIAAIIIIVSLWEKFQTNPTITGLDTEFHNWDVPFPALTLCQKNPSNMSLVSEYIQKRWKDADEDKRAYYEGFLVALANISYASLPALEPYVMDSTLPQENLKQILYEIVSRCHVLTECIWKGEEVGELECCPFFNPILTENGFCYTFNLRFNESDWPYESSRRENFQPQFIEETDLLWSMSVDTEDAQNNTAEVYITSVDDMPFYGSDPQHVWNKRIARLSFASKETYTTDNTRQLSIRQRRCVFEDEIELLTDTKYSYSACMRQCRMELARKMCGCIPFFYPPVARESKEAFRYCKLSELGCIIKDIDLFHKTALDCPCELGCKHTVYDMQNLEDAGPDQEDPLEIGFVSWPLVRYKREVLFGWTDLLVAFGGIAGLFLGFSLLSGVEIIYYFTLRAWCMVYRDKEELERLAEEYEQAENPGVDLSLKPSFVSKSGKEFLFTQATQALSKQRRRKSISAPIKGWPIPYMP